MNSSDFKKTDIKFHVISFIKKNKDFFLNKKILDFPAGNGITSEFLHEIGADVHAHDVFPEYFKIKNLTCTYSNINDQISSEDSSFDCIICQEGIEHFQDQVKSFQEFNRLLKKDGRLFITTPNTSNLRSRLSVLLTESEHFKKIMSVNEMDTIWKSQAQQNEIYFGHVFLISASKLRMLAKISGFELINQHKTESNLTSILLFPLFFPFIFIASYLLFLRNKSNYNPGKNKVYKNLFKLTTSFKTLTQGHLFYEFKKVSSLIDSIENLNNVHKEFGKT